MTNQFSKLSMRSSNNPFTENKYTLFQTLKILIFILDISNMTISYFETDSLFQLFGSDSFTKETVETDYNSILNRIVSYYYLDLSKFDIGNIKTDFDLESSQFFKIQKGLIYYYLNF